MKEYAIIVAGGHGSRMGQDVPKQFLELSGKWMLHRTIDAFISYNPSLEFIVVLPKAHFDTWQSYCQEKMPHFKGHLVEGGKTRFESVKNALPFIGAEGLVAVHDGARPLVLPKTIKRCFEAAREHGSAVPVVAAKESMRLVENAQNHNLDRSSVRIVQTPQCFKSGILIQSYEQAHANTFTDDASVVEKAGNSIHLIEGQENNLKITTPLDLEIARLTINLK